MTSHASWVHATTSLSTGGTTSLSLPSPAIREPEAEYPWQFYTGSAEPGVEDQEVFKDHALWAVESWEGSAKGSLWIRPGCDGLLLTVGDGSVRDDVYG